MNLPRVLVTLVLGTALGLGACGNDEPTGAQSAPTATDSRPAPVRHVCFKGEPLQVSGGKGLAGIAQERGGGAPTDATLNGIVRDAFGATLRPEIRRLEASGADGAAVASAARDAFERVRADPALLLDAAALQATFANAQRLAETSGLSSPGCGTP